MATKKAAKSPKPRRAAKKAQPVENQIVNPDTPPNEDPEVASPKKVKKHSVEDRLAELERNATLHGWHLDYGDDPAGAQ